MDLAKAVVRKELEIKLQKGDGLDLRRATETAKAPLGVRTFEVVRQHDVSGVSGTGVVMEGVVFSTGVCIVHWLTPAPKGSINIFDDFEQFHSIHVGGHPENKTIIRFDDGKEIRQEEEDGS